MTMLDSLDVLVSFAVVMLVVSLAVTAFIQTITTLLQLRGWHLFRGIATLVRQLDPAIEKKIADDIAWAVVRHPLVSRNRYQIASVVQREELVQLMLSMAAGDRPALKCRAREVLIEVLKRQGIDDPAAVLRDIRTTAMNLEQSRPELAAHVRQTAAVVSEAKSDFVAGVNAWFDATMDRVSLMFGGNTRMLTVVTSFLVVGALQMDAIQLVNRLSVDEPLRNRLLSEADSLKGQPPSESNQSRLAGIRELTEAGIVSLPWQRTNSTRVVFGRTLPSFIAWDRKHDLGIAISIALLSLGAPFWYNTLNSLMSLRSKLASKEDTARLDRAGPQDERTVAVAVRRDDDTMAAVG
jgi:hypothetical protein